MSELKLPSTMRVQVGDNSWTVFLARDNPQRDGSIVYRKAKKTNGPELMVAIYPEHKAVWP
jgi:hypothetical protein